MAKGDLRTRWMRPTTASPGATTSSRSVCPTAIARRVPSTAATSSCTHLLVSSGCTGNGTQGAGRGLMPPCPQSLLLLGLIRPCEHAIPFGQRRLGIERAVGEAEMCGKGEDRSGRQRDPGEIQVVEGDRKSTRLNSSHVSISYAVFCLKKKNERESTH